MVEKQRGYLELRAEAAKLLQQAEELRAKEVEQVIEEIREKMQSYGINPQDLGFASSRTGKTGRKIHVQVRYRGPNGKEWSGRGLTPKWLREEIANGKTREDFYVK
ncbi:MAG: H-NS histone family protein [Candidatus Accumulibacter sp.]|nr:H-NS histone family protein [Accumulibacter sp.]